MSIRFRRTVKIAPGVRLNIGKKNVSVRIGGRGYGLTVGSAGTTVSAGIPGTGVYMTKRLSSATRRGGSSSSYVADDNVASPPEPGTRAPTGWILTAIVCAFMGFSGVTVLLPVAVISGWVAWRRLKSPKYVALKKIREAKALRPTDAARADAIVRAAANEVSDSWTVQLEAASYFAEKGAAEAALDYYTKALRLMPGDRRKVLLTACKAALSIGKNAWVIETLEPLVSALEPEQSELDAALLTSFALAQLGEDRPRVALEVMNRLPLRRRNLTPTLLYGLCVRALAKHAAGQKASAQRDLERVYSIDPGFPFLKTAREIIEQHTTA